MTISNADRSAGVLLHPTSLPGPFGIGDLGPAARWWVDAMGRAGQTWWQVLPLGPTGYGDSPYSALSAFAGNALLVSPEDLVADGLLKKEDLHGIHLPEDRVDYGAVIDLKTRLLTQAWRNFQSGASPRLRQEMDSFCSVESYWLDDYALFKAVKQKFGGKDWQEWPRDLKQREPAALRAAREKLGDDVRQLQFRQFLFYRQWHALRDYARPRGVRFIGDIPIFVAGDSADVWAHAEIFLLDEDRRPKVVAGVPPDYFSRTGQLWGNPHYDWERLRRNGYRWWADRVKATLGQVDLIRLDHFLGFEKAWHIPAGMATAEKGKFVPGPRADFFERMREALGGLPFIAEDLGLVTPEVEALRDRFGLPGMFVLQFAFGGAPESRFLPHNHERNGVVYTGTHDNDTTGGWYHAISEKERDHFRRYVARDGGNAVWDLIRLAWSSVANYAVAPLQDVLNLGTEARMNFPGQPGGNWAWRFRRDMLTDDVIGRLRTLTDLYGRAPSSGDEGAAG